MPVGYSLSVSQAVLNALCNATPFTGPVTLYAQLHVGDPGANGVLNPAVETRRMLASFALAGVDGTVKNDAPLIWDNIAGSQDATHCSIWDLAAAGVFQFSGLITAAPYTAGQNLVITVGSLVATVPLAS